MPCGATKTGRSWWRGLTEGGPLEKVMANHFTCIIINPCMTRQISESCCESIWKNVFWVCSLVCILDHTLSWTGSMEPEIGTLKEIKGLLLFFKHHFLPLNVWNLISQQMATLQVKVFLEAQLVLIRSFWVTYKVKICRKVFCVKGNCLFQ